MFGKILHVNQFERHLIKDGFNEICNPIRYEMLIFNHNHKKAGQMARFLIAD